MKDIGSGQTSEENSLQMRSGDKPGITETLPFETVLSSTPDLIYVFDLDHRFTFANKALLDMWGKTWDEAAGKTCLELGYEPWHAEMHDREIDTVVATKQPIRGEVPFEGTNGRRDYDYIFVPVFDEDGEVKAVAGTTRDISERKVVEANLQRAVEFDEAIMTNMSEGLYTVDAQGSIMTMNPAAERLFGIKLDDVRGQNFHEVVHYLKPDGSPFPAEECQTLQALMKGRYITNEDEVFVRGDGTLFDAVYSSSPIKIGEDYSGSVVVFRDVTEEKRIEAELRASEARIRIAVEAARQVTWEWDLIKDEVFWNDRNQSVFGKTRLSNPAKSNDFFEVLHVGDLNNVRAAIEKAAAEKSVIDLDFRSQRDDGSYRWISAYGQITQWIGGKATRLSGVASDVTEKKKAEEALIKSEQKLRETVDALRQKAALVELSSEAILVWNLDTGIVEWNKGAEELYGYTRSEAIGQISHELLKTEHTGGLDNFERSILENGTWFGEVQHTTKDGRELAIESRQQIIEIQGQRLFLETNRNVTERRETERALQKSEEKYRTLFNAIDEGFCTIDILFDETGIPVDYRFIEYNPMFADLTGLQDAAGKTALELVPELESFWIETYGQVALTGESVRFESGSQAMGRWFDVFASKIGGESSSRVALVFSNITQRKSSEEALRKSEERRHLAQTAGNVGVWDWDIVADKTYWSDTMWKMYGLERHDINPDDSFWSSHLHAADRERVRLNIQNVVSSGSQQFHDEYRIIWPNGSVRWIEATANVSHDESGRAVRMYGVNLDITERKEIEERVKLSENQLRLVTNAVPALISYVDSNERYRFVNQQFNEWFGISTDEMVGQKVRDVFGMPAYRVVKPWIDRALAGEQVAFETAMTYGAVGTRYVHISYMPDIGVDGTVYGYYGLTNDLTDLKRSQDLLRSTEERMALMVENVTDYAILSTDSEGRIDSWNTGAELIFGYTSTEIVGRSCEILFTPEDVTRGIPQKEMRTARQKGRASDDRWHLRKNGTRFFANGVMMPLRVGNVITGYAKIASDLTEKQRRAEELQKAHDELEHRVKERTRELAESNLALVKEMEVREIAERQKIELLGRLVASQEVERRRIARDLHDQLGQRLTALRLKIASLREVSVAYPDIEARVERLQEIGESLDSEVSFLAWELRPTALDDLGLIDAVGAFVNEWSMHYEIAAEFHSSGLSKGRLNHDTETHLYRITQEALNNITKHAAADHVTVLLEKRDNNVILIVEDNGKGFISNSNRISSDSDMGLGLIGMGERAALAGGDLEVESSPGNGTTIYVRVPM